jgi:20S proteasome subunit alpha 2
MCCRYQDDLSLEDAIHTAILVLKDGFEGSMTSESLEIGVLSLADPSVMKTEEMLPEFKGLAKVPKFHILSENDIADYLANI